MNNQELRESMVMLAADAHHWLSIGQTSKGPQASRLREAISDCLRQARERHMEGAIVDALRALSSELAGHVSQQERGGGLFH